MEHIIEGTVKNTIEYTIRNAVLQDLDHIAAIEACCFPEAEAADKASFLSRLKTFPGSFFVAEDRDGRMSGFINGCVTDRRTICDEMFEDCAYHEENGAYQSIFGLDVIPACRRQGMASGLMKHMIDAARQQGRKGLILTCKEGLIPFYQSFGYETLGVSESVHGGAVWYDMVLEF